LWFPQVSPLAQLVFSGQLNEFFLPKKIHKTMKHLIFFFLTLFPMLAFAHSGSIRLQVVDAETKKPLPDIPVILKPSASLQITNSAGEVRWEQLQPETYNIQVQAIGYSFAEVEIKLREHETLNETIALNKKATQLKEVSIQSSLSVQQPVLRNGEILSRPLASGQEMLRLVPGLFIAQHAGGGKAEQIFMRGFDCDHGTDVALTVDGMPVNMVSHAHGQGYADLHFLMPEIVDRMQISKGTYDSRHGNFSTAGAIGFNTLNKIGSNQIKLEAGSFDTYRGYAQMNLFGKKLQDQNQQLYIAGEYLFRKGFFENPDNLNRSNVFLKYTGTWKKHHQVSASVSDFRSDWNASGQIPLRAVNSGLISRYGSIDPTEGGRTSRINSNIQVTSDLHRGRIVKQQVFFNQYQFQLYSNFTFFANDSTAGDKIRQTEKRNILGYKSSYHQGNLLGKRWLQSEIGMQLRSDWADNTELSYVNPDNSIRERLAYGNIQENNLSFYLNEDLQWNKRVRFNFGLREDIFSFHYNNHLDTTVGQVTKAITSPKLSMFYQASSRLELFLQGGKGFHSNDTRVVIARQGQTILPAAWGSEVGFNYYSLKNLRINFSLWSLRLQQEFVYVGDEAIVEPGGETQRLGMDVGMHYQFCSWLGGHVDVNYSMPRALGVPTESNRIPLAPSFTSIGELRATVSKKLQGSLRYRWLGDRPANEDNSSRAKGYFLLDGIVNYNYKNFSFGLSADNLLNTRWMEAQFETESKLKHESEPVSEIHFTSGTPRFVSLHLAYRW
jgi:hypothetical protein